LYVFILLYTIQGNSTLVYAGAGIVEGTNPSSEWEELDLKASQVKENLAHLKASQLFVYLFFIYLRWCIAVVVFIYLCF
jgi:hypothetical protein